MALKLIKVILAVGVAVCMADRQEGSFDIESPKGTSKECANAVKKLHKLLDYLPGKIDKLMTKADSQFYMAKRIVKVATESRKLSETLEFVENNNCLQDEKETAEAKRKDAALKAKIEGYASELATHESGATDKDGNPMKVSLLSQAIAEAKATSQHGHHMNIEAFMNKIFEGVKITDQELSTLPDPTLDKKEPFAGVAESCEEEDDEDREEEGAGLMEVSAHEDEDFMGSEVSTSGGPLDVLIRMGIFFYNVGAFLVLMILGVLWFCLDVFAGWVPGFFVGFAWFLTTCVACAAFWLMANILGRPVYALVNWARGKSTDLGVDSLTGKCFQNLFFKPVDAGMKVLAWGFINNPMNHIDDAISYMQFAGAAGVVANITAITGAAATIQHAIGQ